MKRRSRRCATTRSATGAAGVARDARAGGVEPAAPTAPADRGGLHERRPGGDPRTPDWLCGLVLLAEPVAEWGTPDQVDQLAGALAPHAGHNVVMDDACAAFGPVARPLGVLDAAAGRHEEAAATSRKPSSSPRAGVLRGGSWPRSPTGCRAASHRRGRTRCATAAWRWPANSASRGSPRRWVRPRCRSSPASLPQVPLGGDHVAALPPVSPQLQRIRKPFGP